MQKLLTIVVPVYKVEPYINKCLDSCLIFKTNEHGEKMLDEEMMDQLEVIIVNDGTPDNSAEMSREYVKRYPQTFRQIDKENGGHGSAWNVGLKEAIGKYLRFLDSDDWLTNLDSLMLDLKSCDADVVFNPFDVVDSTGNKSLVPNPVLGEKDGSSDGGMAYPITREIWMTSGYKYSNVNFWSVTYKTEILKPLWPLFAEKVMYDDYILTWAPLVYGRTCVALDYVLYNYLVGRPGNSMTVSVMKKRAISYDGCMRQYETVRNGILEETVPRELLECIDEMISNCAKFIFWYEVFLPYKMAKERLQHLYESYLEGTGFNSAVLIRYLRLPFFFFYWVEHLRYIINEKTSK